MPRRLRWDSVGILVIQIIYGSRGLSRFYWNLPPANKVPEVFMYFFFLLETPAYCITFPCGHILGKSPPQEASNQPLDCCHVMPNKDWLVTLDGTIPKNNYAVWCSTSLMLTYTFSSCQNHRSPATSGKVRTVKFWHSNLIGDDAHAYESVTLMYPWQYSNGIWGIPPPWSSFNPMKLTSTIRLELLLSVPFAHNTAFAGIKAKRPIYLD